MTNESNFKKMITGPDKTTIYERYANGYKKFLESFEADNKGIGTYIAEVLEYCINYCELEGAKGNEQLMELFVASGMNPNTMYLLCRSEKGRVWWLDQKKRERDEEFRKDFIEVLFPGVANNEDNNEQQGEIKGV